ncbi:MAG TPA: 2,3-diketo-5-methylthiopentyl-1-phosphate enolase [bacterium]|nr:2,3-diketo-5-methylthiopentyl-1-phosphate enolase [bacterium]
MAGYDPVVFQNPERAFDGDLVVATYWLEAATPDLVKKAGDIAIGQTTGGWTELPRATREVMQKAVGRLLSVIEVPPAEDRLPSPATGALPEKRRAVVRVGFPVDNLAGDIAAMLVAVYGKVSLDGAIKLVDLEIPKSFAQKLPGPKLGIEGVRKALGPDAAERPLAMSIFKPSLGLSAEALADMLGEQAAGGMDLVKDDEVLADEKVDSALKRLELGLNAVAKSGRKMLYAISLTGPADELIARARKLSKAGAGALLFNVHAYGFPMMAALARDPEVSAAIMSHPALAGGFSIEANHGIAAHLALGKLARLAGADLVLFPSPYGSVGIRRESALKLSFACTRELHGLKRAFPIPSAGITPSLVPQLIADYGHDVIVNAGGSVHGHPDGARAGAEAFVAATRAAAKGVALPDAAKDSPALKKALEIWK